MKYLHVQLSNRAHEIINEIKFAFNLPNKAAAVEKALEIAIKQIEREAKS